MMTKTSPVFLVASVRSGSTMLKLMLNHHPLIVNPGECDFLFDYVTSEGGLPQVSDYENKLRFNRIYQAMGLTIDPSSTYLEVMTSFVKQFRPNREVLVMNVHRHFERIPHVFPNARYIHLERDPRDVARSCVKLGWAGHVYCGVDIWKDANESWSRLKAQLDDTQFIEIKYEGLLDDIESGLGRICEFLELEYSEAMLSYSASSNYRLPDKKLSYQWKTKYTPRELQLVEGKVGEEIEGRGYLLSGREVTLPGPVERACLMTFNKFSKIKYQIRAYGLVHYISSLVSRHLHLKSLNDRCKQKKNAIDALKLK